jgi:hypothetical protein
MQENDGGLYDIRFEDRDGYFYAFISGNSDSLAVSRKYWQRVVDECSRRGYKCLLVEEEFPNQLSKAEMHTLVVAIKGMLTKPLKIAFVDRKTEHTDLNLFGETVAVNRGISGRVFPEIATAEEWLKS